MGVRTAICVALATTAGCYQSVEAIGTVVGSDGGLVRASGVWLEIPPGALQHTHRVHIVEDDEIELGGGADRWSPVFRFEPLSLELDVPATVSLRYDGAPRAPFVWWAGEDRIAEPMPRLGDRGATVGWVEARVDRLGYGVVGGGCTRPCDP